MKKLYGENLSFNSTEDDVNQLFNQYGKVQSIDLINDRETGRPRDFGFVEMDNDGANKAMSALDGEELDGRIIKENEAQERRPRGGGGGRGW